MTSRKDFLGTLAAAAATPAASAQPMGVPRRLPKSLAYFDDARFQSILDKPARHKQVFGVMKLGEGLEGMNNSIAAYEALEGAPTLHAVAVLYHGPSILMALSDAFWNGVIASAKSKPHEAMDFWEQVQPGKGNPYLHSKTRNPNDVSVESLAAKGSHFFVCNNALLGFAGILASALHENADEMHQRMLAALVPSSMAVPAGVMAVNACQEARFTYIAT